MSYLQQRPDNQNIRESQGQRKKTITLLIKKENGIINTTDHIINIKTPSSRVMGGIELFFETDALIEEVNIVFKAPTNWYLQARASGIKTDSLGMHFIDPPQATAVGVQNNPPTVNVPRSYEFNSAVKIIKAGINLRTPEGLAGFGLNGEWYARAFWEANTPISDKELTDIFNECRIEKIK